jgi:hypothetical protein
MQIVPTILTPSNGIRTTSGQTSTSGVVSSETSLITVLPNDVLKSFENLGTPVLEVKGDGRFWTVIQPSSPTSQVAGDCWLENDSTLGVVFRYFDGTTIHTTSTVPPGNELTSTAVSALIQGFALRMTGAGAAYANTTVDGARQFQVIGVVKDTVILGATVEVLTDGDILSLTDWTVLTGSTHLTPGAQYFLSDTPGKYTTAIPGSGVVSRIGIAGSTTQLLIQPNLIILP